jgi:hypothetical protein
VTERRYVFTVQTRPLLGSRKWLTTHSISVTSRCDLELTFLEMAMFRVVRVCTLKAVLDGRGRTSGKYAETEEE